MTKMKARRCKSRNSAGRRCILFNVGLTRHKGLHMNGAVTWNEPRSTGSLSREFMPGRNGESVDVTSMFGAASPLMGGFSLRRRDDKPKLGSALHEAAETAVGHAASFILQDEAHLFKQEQAPEEGTKTPREQLADWWRKLAESEISQTVDKAIEYGSTDLVDIGYSLARISGRDVEDDEAAEMGVFFYLEGKFARWRSALERGDRPSADTLLDIGVYVRMAQRIRESGGWPGVDLEEHPTEQQAFKEGGPV